jgi:hypothetical protein
MPNPAALPKGFIPDTPQNAGAPPAGFIPDSTQNALDVVSGKSGGMSAPPDSGIMSTLGNAVKAGQGYFDKLTAMEPHKMPHSMADVGTETLKGLGNAGAGLMSLASPIVHPVKALAAIGGMTPPVQAYDDISHAFNPQHPQSVMSDMAQGVAEHPLESGEMLAGQIAGGEGAGMTGRAVGRITDPLKDYRSPVISTPEAIGRRTTDILHPNPAAYRGVSSAITDNAPYIKDFAESTGNKFKTPLDFSKAATGAGQEASNFFKENLIEPNAEVPTPHGNIAEVHQRLGEINDELRPAYRQRTGGQELTALDRKNLEAERDQLNDTLYSTLSERSGLPVERIQGINQRGGALQNVGDEADAAQSMRRAGFSGYTPNGLPMPFTAMERGMRLLNYLRGGPERVAGRQLGRVFNQVGSPAEPLPDPQEIGNYRQMAEQSDLGNMGRKIQMQDQNKAASMARKPEGMGPTQPPQSVEATSPDPQLRNMADSIASRKGNITQQREIQQAGSDAERLRQNENFATRGTRLDLLKKKLKEQ